MVKIYTSGSLLEDREIPVDFQETVLKDCYELNKELIIESRCEQLTVEKLAWATALNPSFTVAIGLEAYDDEVTKGSTLTKDSLQSRGIERSLTCVNLT